MITKDFEEKILRKYVNTMTEEALDIENIRKEETWKKLVQIDFEEMTEEEYNEYKIIMFYTDKETIRKWMDDLEK